MPQFKVENLYRTTITSSSGIAASGDVNFTVTTPPINPNGYIVISPDSTTLREIMYYHNVSGSTIYVRAENRISPKAHSKNEVVQINDVAEIFNTYSDMISTCFYVEKTGGLTVKVWGGTVYYNGTPQTVADTNLTLTDSATNYIKYDFATNVISVDTVNSGNIKVSIIVVSGGITSIDYKVAKESLATQGPQGIQGIQGIQGPTGPAGGGDMLKSDNLSGLANYTTARLNLGLGNVDNTADTAKPVSTVQQTALNLKANLASPTFTGTVGGITAAMVGAATSTQGTTADNALPKAGGVMTGKVTKKGVDEVGATYAPTSGAQTVALNAATNNIHEVTGNAAGTAMTFTISGMTNSQVIIVSILQGAVVSTITAWFSTVRWAGGTTPTLTATVGKRDTFAFKRTGANTYDGFIIGQNC